MQNDLRIVNRSLAAFYSLRRGLAYLRSISIGFDNDTYLDQSLPNGIARRFTDVHGQNSEEELEFLLDCLYRSVILMHSSLLYAALCHYEDLVRHNPRLANAELNQGIETMKDCGLWEGLRNLRNAVFHVDPSSRVQVLLNEVLMIVREHKISLGHLEDLLYECTSDIFSGTEIFQKSREELDESFEKTLKYYDDNFT